MYIGHVCVCLSLYVCACFEQIESGIHMYALVFRVFFFIYFCDVVEMVIIHKLI